MFRSLIIGIVVVCFASGGSPANAQAPLIVNLAVSALRGLATGVGQRAGEEIYDRIKGGTPHQQSQPDSSNTAQPNGNMERLPGAQIVPIVPPTPADGIQWRMRNEHGADIILQFYSPARRVHWPAGDQAYRLVSEQSAMIRLRCVPGEKICYGGAVPGRYWGTGLGLRFRCANCCRQCGSEALGVTLR